MKPLLLEIPNFFGFSIEVYFIVTILSIPFFFFWRWLFRKVIKSKLAVAIASWVTAFITAPFVYLLLIVIWVTAVSYYPHKDFNRSDWFAYKDRRYELSENIIQSNMLLGKKKSEVKQLLGEDEVTQDASDYWRYYLGYKPSLLRIDPDVLDIYFENGKVVKVGQHET